MGKRASTPDPRAAAHSIQPSDGRVDTASRSTVDLSALTVERLYAELVDLAKRLSAGTYELLLLVGELDARGSWAAWGALSCAAWLADACGIEVSTARSHVRVARAMRAHPNLEVAMRSGEVSYA